MLACDGSVARQSRLPCTAQLGVAVGVSGVRSPPPCVHVSTCAAPQFEYWDTVPRPSSSCVPLARDFRASELVLRASGIRELCATGDGLGSRWPAHGESLLPQARRSDLHMLLAAGQLAEWAGRLIAPCRTASAAPALGGAVRATLSASLEWDVLRTLLLCFSRAVTAC